MHGSCPQKNDQSSTAGMHVVSRLSAIRPSKLPTLIAHEQTLATPVYAYEVPGA